MPQDPYQPTRPREPVVYSPQLLDAPGLRQFKATAHQIFVQPAGAHGTGNLNNRNSSNNDSNDRNNRHNRHVQPASGVVVDDRESFVRATQHPETPHCPICFADDDSFLTLAVRLTRCKHVFCERCIIEWAHQGSRKCPLCNGPFVILQEPSACSSEFFFGEDRNLMRNSLWQRVVAEEHTASGGVAGGSPVPELPASGGGGGGGGRGASGGNGVGCGEEGTTRGSPGRHCLGSDGDGGVGGVVPRRRPVETIEAGGEGEADRKRRRLKANDPQHSGSRSASSNDSDVVVGLFSADHATNGGLASAKGPPGAAAAAPGAAGVATVTSTSSSSASSAAAAAAAAVATSAGEPPPPTPSRDEIRTLVRAAAERRRRESGRIRRAVGSKLPLPDAVGQPDTAVGAVSMTVSWLRPQLRFDNDVSAPAL
jgi:hypothetical protein